MAPNPASLLETSGKRDEGLHKSNIPKESLTSEVDGVLASPRLELMQESDKETLLDSQKNLVVNVVQR